MLSKSNGLQEFHPLSDAVAGYRRMEPERKFTSDLSGLSGAHNRR